MKKYSDCTLYTKIKLNNYIFPYPGENLHVSEISWKNDVCAFVQMGMEKFVYLFDKKLFSKYLFVIIYDKFFLMSFE